MIFLGINCQGSEKDPQFGDHYAGWDHVQANQKTYDAGQDQIFKGQTRDALVSGNFKKDPVGTTLAGAGMIGFGVATGGALASPSLMSTGAAIGMTVNGAMQLSSDDPFDKWSLGVSGVTGALTAAQPFTSSVITNMAGAYAGSVVRDQNPNNEILGAAVGTAIGYSVGRKSEKIADKTFNPWYREVWKDFGLGISGVVGKNPMPKIIGNGASTFTQELSSQNIKNNINKKDGNGN